MRHLLPILFIVALAGCSASAKYDIDVTCDIRNGGYFEPELMNGTEDDPLQYMSCGLGGADEFLITCTRDTYQRINDIYYCTTKDDKSVRVRIFK